MHELVDNHSGPTLKIITANLNGVRSAANKGFFDWLQKQGADVVCIQETKAQEYQLEHEQFYPPGYHVVYNDAQKKGYSGTALYSRIKPRNIVTELGWDVADTHGRYIQADFKDVTVISLYMPSGSSGEAAQARKDEFLELFYPVMEKLKRRRRHTVICADWNICHKEIDLKNWRSNQKNSGFLPHERAWIDKVFTEGGWCDAFREINPEPDQYTWWSNRGNAYANNVGWRLDYQVVTPGLRPLVRSAEIYKDEKFSDHAPLIMEYDFEISE